MSLVLPSVQAREGSYVTDSDEARICVCKQAAIKTISDRLYTPLWCGPVSLSLTHVHTHNVQNSAFEQSIANT